MNHDRLIELLRDDGLVASAKIAAPLKFGAMLLRNLDRFVIGDPRKRRHDLLQFREIPLESLQLGRPSFQDALNDERYETFCEIHHVLDGAVGNLGFDHPEFGQMAPRFGFLGTKRWAEAIDLTQRSRSRLTVQLSGV